MNDAEIKLQVKIDDSTASKSVNTLSKKTDNLSKSFTNVGKTLTTRLTLPIVGLIGVGVKYNATIEQLTTSFEVMTGSADEATKLVQKLKDLGAKTPYELVGLAETTQLLMQYGLTSEEAYGATVNLGDISQGSAEKMQSIALAYGQMSSAGKVNMQDIKQMINAGFNPLQAIMEMTGETMAEVTQRYEEGKISVDEITEAMKYASSENGKYYQSMEKQSQTTTGKLSTLKDEFLSATGSLTESLIPALQSGVTWLTNISSWFSSLSEGQRKTILTVMGILAAIGPLLIMFSKLIQLIKVAKIVFAAFNLVLSLNPIGLIILGVAALIAILVLLWIKCDWFRKLVKILFEGVMWYLKTFIANIKLVWSVVNWVINKMAYGFKVMIDGVKKAFYGLKSAISNVFKGIYNLVKTPINFVIRGLNKISFKAPSWVPKIGGKSFGIHIPYLATGTNNVAQEGLAYLHQGEAVVPKKYNPAIGGGNANMSSPVYVNVEVQQDKFGNYTNTIKTFSNGSKNSYNYGAS